MGSHLTNIFQIVYTKRYLKYFFVFLLVLVTVVSAFYFAWGYAACRFVTKKLACYVERNDALFQRKGTEASLQYVYDAVLPYSGYGLVHELLHYVGDNAYNSTKDLGQSLSLVSPYVALFGPEDGEYLRGFDGYMHGVLSAFYLDTKKDRSFEKLSAEICHSEILIPSITTTVFDCFHALGHALVFANENNIDMAVTICQKIEDPDSRNGCLFGSYMEMSKLYDPTYHKSSTRAGISGTSMKQLCDTQASSTKQNCYMFVGESYLLYSGGNLKGALKVCESVADPYVRTCLGRTIRQSLVSRATDLSDIDVLCQKVSEANRQFCSDTGRNWFVASKFGIQDSSPMEMVRHALRVVYLYYF